MTEALPLLLAPGSRPPVTGPAGAVVGHVTTEDLRGEPAGPAAV
ncbi:MULTISPECIES: hypothetical protein [unclassified Streptomyces]